ncbi:MAG TPA: helix-turn-helix domain-containing protein [Solirubrobacteraceae bacterium]|nr:helix-turn-helix domain-containing protein [Solirubrobacteraceae bacterium]
MPKTSRRTTSRTRKAAPARNGSVEPIPSVSITLSPAQVDEVLRAASRQRAPSIATMIADALAAPRDPQANGNSGHAGAEPPRVDRVDPRMSRSLLRGLSILTCFGPEGEPRGVVEIAQTLGMSPSTTHRYTLTLVELGLLERCPRTRKYRPCRPQRS